MKILNLKTLLLKRFNITDERNIRKTLRSFTIAEKSVFYFFIIIFIASSLALLSKVNNAFMIEIPYRGGTLVEGVVGNPRFINPVLAISEADRNLSALVYSGLANVSAEGGVLPGLALSIDISSDG